MKKPKVKERAIPRPVNISDGDVALFDKLAEEILHGERDIFNALRPREREAAIAWLSAAIVDGETRNSIHDILWQEDYKRKPVDIETFIEDDNYLGRIGRELHPKWKDDLKIVNAPGSKIIEWIFTGAIGIGKTTIAMTQLAYKLHRISCLHDPSKFYGLLSDSLIIFGLYSITKKQVNDSGYFQLRSYIDSSPYFRREFPRNMKIDSKMEFGPHKLLQVIAGSREMHALGMNLFSYCMDEVNFMQVRKQNAREAGKVTGQAYDLYNATRTRLLSRFMRPGGVIPGIMMLMSSRNSQTSFLEEHLKQISSDTTHVSDYPLWEMKGKHKFTKPKFLVEVGDRVSRSRILRETDKPRATARVIEIPGEFLAVFEQDIDQGLRDMAGVATFNLSPLISDRKSVFDAFRDDLVHPFSKQTITIDVNNETMIEDFFQVRSVCKVVNSKWTPKLNPNQPRYIHIDIGLRRDCAAIAMSHMSGYKVVEKMRDDGTKTKIKNPCVIVDFMLQIKPPVGSEIDLSKIRAFVLYLRSLYPVVMVTFDGFQSVDSVQILRKQKIDAQQLSVDRTDEPYISLRAALYERRLFMYSYEPFEKEVLFLERDIETDKIDHPVKFPDGTIGSKDVADAVCGCVYRCLTDDRAAGTGIVFEMTNNDIMSKRTLDPKQVPVTTTVDAGKALVNNNATSVPSGIDWDALRENF